MAESVMNQQEKNSTQFIDDQKENNRLKAIIGVILSFFMIVITAYVYSLQNQNYRILSSSSTLDSSSFQQQSFNYRTYVQKYQDTQYQLEETTKKLEVVKSEQTG